MSSITVSNPYSFNISKNTSFTSPAIAPSLPDKDTLLITIEDEIKTITIPAGCKVVEAYCYTMASGADNAEVIVYDTINNKLWCHIVGDFYGATDIAYVGVTPNKTYTLSVRGRGDNPTCEISYSKNINNKTPTVTDY